jgi:3-oxoadipate enol-lactonase
LVTDVAAHDIPVAPRLPPGRLVELPGRGTTFIREVAGPPGAPTLVLLHGWTASADLNWFPSFGPLGRSYRVVAPDLRGHGRGIRSRRPFRLERCADDVALLAEVLGLSRIIPVGYSMGGPVAQLVWRRHPGLVAGLVLCATSRNFSGTREERFWFAGLGGAALASRLAPATAQRRVAQRVIARRADRGYEAWALDEMRRHDWTAVLEAGRALGRFSSAAWVGDIDVPVSVVVTGRDHVVSSRRQVRLAESIPGASMIVIDGDHDACVTRPQVFVPALLRACGHVVAAATPPRP